MKLTTSLKIVANKVDRSNQETENLVTTGGLCLRTDLRAGNASDEYRAISSYGNTGYIPIAQTIGEIIDYLKA